MAPSVLLVHPDSHLLDDIRSCLGTYDIEIEIASDIDAATALLVAHTYSGLILSIPLDKGSGVDVLRFVAERNLGVPAVVVAPDGARERKGLREEQVKLVLPSPGEPRLLAAVVKGLCGIAA